MEPLAGLLGAAGFVLGIAADRLAVRWPEHDEEHPAGRAVDWRTALVALVGALALGLLVLRFGGDALALAIFGAWFVTLIIGLATDLDQRIPRRADPAGHPGRADLCDQRQQPARRIGGLAGRGGRAGHPGRAVPAVHPVRCRCVRWPGDVKLLIGVGLLAGGERALGCAIFAALLLAGVVLAMLLAARRIGRKTYVPFRPFFIIGALWAVLLRP